METRRNGPQPRAYPGTTGLPGASEYPEHHALYGAGAGSVQGVLAGLTSVEGVTRLPTGCGRFGSFVRTRTPVFAALPRAGVVLAAANRNTNQNSYANSVTARWECDKRAVFGLGCNLIQGTSLPTLAPTLTASFPKLSAPSTAARWPRPKRSTMSFRIGQIASATWFPWPRTRLWMRVGWRFFPIPPEVPFQLHR